MTVEQLLKMDPDATMAWMQENRAAFELVPVTPSDEMIKAAAGPDFSQEDRELGAGVAHHGHNPGRPRHGAAKARDHDARKAGVPVRARRDDDQG